MTVTITSKLIYSLVLLSPLLIGYKSESSAGFNYEFKEEQVKNVSWKGEDKIVKKDVFNLHFLNTVDSKNEKDLCKDSNPTSDLCEFVRASNSLSVNYYSYEGADLYEIEEQNGNVRRDVAIQCSTIPDVWLRPGSSNKEIILMFLSHVAQNYTYNYEFFDSIEPIHGSDYTEHHWLELKRNYLTSFEHRDCDYFCFWAHKQIDVFSPEQRKKNLDDSTLAHTATFYRAINLEHEKKEEYIAIKCRTEPEMYLRLGNEGNNKLTAMFVQPKIEPLEV